MPGAESARRYRERHPDRVRASKRKYNTSERGRAVTAAYNARYNSGTMFMVALNKADPCTDCGDRFPAEVMEFDHRDSDSKLDDIAVLARTKKPTVVFAEIAKCDLVCANCHRIRTINRRFDSTQGSH